MLRIAAIFAVFIVSLAIWLGMTQQPRGSSDLNIAYISLETLDPQLCRASEDVRVAYALFEGLVTVNPHTMQPLPGMAARWDVGPEYQQYTFYLRDDARWSDGSAVTAEDFATAWMWMLLPDTAGPYIKFLHVIDGAADYTDWAIESLQAIRDRPADQRLDAAHDRLRQMRPVFDRMVGVEVIDVRTLKVTLAKPTPYFLDLVGTWPFFPLHRPTILAHSELDPNSYMLSRDSHWTRARTMVSNGPYVLEDWSFKHAVKLRANPQFHDADKVALERVHLNYFTDAEAAFRAFESGAVDLVIGTTVPYAPDLVNMAEQGLRDDVHPVTNFGTYYFNFNCRPELTDGSSNPFADPRVRRAFSMVVEKQQIVEHVTRLNQPVAHSFVPPDSIVGYQPARGVGYDIQRAQQLLAEAGYPQGDGLPPILVIYNTGGGHENTVQALCAMWEEHLGVQTRTESQEWKVYLGRRDRGDFMIARAGWFGDYGDPTTFLDLLQSTNGNNDGGYADPEYDRLLEHAMAVREPQKRFDLLEQAEALALKDAALLPLYYYRLVLLYDPDELNGVSHHPRNLQLYSWISRQD